MILFETERLSIRSAPAGDTPAASLHPGGGCGAIDVPEAADCRAWSARWKQDAPEDGTHCWTVSLKPCGEPVGLLGLRWRDPDSRRVLEAGVILRTDRRRNGYAAEAARGCLEYAFDTLLADEVLVIVPDGDIAAMNVAIRCGMTIRSLDHASGSGERRYVFSARNPTPRRRQEHAGEAVTTTLPSPAATQPTAEPERSSGIDRFSPPEAKIALFLSLFDGRRDVYAIRRHSRRFDNAYYMPACRNEYRPGVCGKPRQKCGTCKNRDFIPFDAEAVRAHLTNSDENGNGIVGIYPLLPDDTCRLLAIDFDGDGWMEDVGALCGVCEDVGVPCAVERSRSGRGAHAWFFFEGTVPAAQARRLGALLLTRAMARRHEIRFVSYDRMFPNQDTVPKGGFGNLIALPLQGAARKQGNSVFVDNAFRPYPDPWAFLASIRRIAPARLAVHLVALDTEGELGALESAGDAVEDAPWQSRRPPERLAREDFPATLRCVEGNLLFVEKRGLSQRAMNRIRRLAAFPNPAFHQRQRMRMSTFGTPRIVCAAEETEKWIALPRGLRPQLEALAEGADGTITREDQRESGRPIDVRFVGELRMDQTFAVDALATEDDGVMAAATAFGKTVAAIALIARIGRSALILVHTQALLAQWRKAVARFLVDAADGAPVEAGQLGGGRTALTGCVDVATVQSLGSEDLAESGALRGYGVVVVDECHHVPAFTIAKALAGMDARRVYGLTATPLRKDGLQPLIFMHCGPIRYRADARDQAAHGAVRLVLPRVTRFKKPLAIDEEDWPLAQMLRDMVEDEERNRMIVADALKALADGRTPLILTQRVEHVRVLAERLRQGTNAKVFELVGNDTAKRKRERGAEIAATDDGAPMVVVATGQYVGEGFDLPRLDTLLLAMPVSWRGLVAQYAGRLHRERAGKRDVMVYDYVDVHVGVLERMYQRRLKAYAQIGYCTAPAEGEVTGGGVIYDTRTFAAAMKQDFLGAHETILVVSPFITRGRAAYILEWLRPALGRGVGVEIVTRPPSTCKPQAQDAAAWSIAEYRAAGATVSERPAIHQKFVLVDRRLVWYGSLNLLSYGASEESLMRLASREIAQELEASIAPRPGS